jgi:hypothetical protein
MKAKILLFLIVFLPPFNLNAQWERIGFEGQSISDICLRENLLIIPSRYNNVSTVFYGSSDNGITWDSLGYINQPWINELETLQSFVFSSWYWDCGICFPTPCIFRSEDNWINWDTLYVYEYGASNLLVHNNDLFASLGFSFIKSTDYGNTWNVIDSIPPNFLGMYSIDDYLYLYAGSNELYRSEDNGSSWILISSFPGASFTLISNGQYLFTGGIYGVTRSSNGGIDWDLVNTGLPDNFRVEILTAKPNILFASGSDTTYTHLIFCSINNGENWINISEGLNLGKFVWINSLLIKDYFLFTATEIGMWRYNFSTLVNVSDQKGISLEYDLSQNYPNPFNPSTTIKYQIPEIYFVTIKVYDVLGNEIATLVNEEKPAGEYEVEFNGTGLSSGIYFYQLQAGSFVETKKMVLMR